MFLVDKGSAELSNDVLKLSSCVDDASLRKKTVFKLACFIRMKSLIRPPPIRSLNLSERLK